MELYGNNSINFYKRGVPTGLFMFNMKNSLKLHDPMCIQCFFLLYVKISF